MDSRHLIILALLLLGFCGCACPEPKDYQPILEDIRAQLSDIHRMETIILGKLEKQAGEL